MQRFCEEVGPSKNKMTFILFTLPEEIMFPYESYLYGIVNVSPGLIFGGGGSFYL